VTVRSWFKAADECFDLNATFPFDPVTDTSARFVRSIGFLPNGSFATRVDEATVNIGFVHHIAWD
jgi:hypothetical protein